MTELTTRQERSIKLHNKHICFALAACFCIFSAATTSHFVRYRVLLDVGCNVLRRIEAASNLLHTQPAHSQGPSLPSPPRLVESAAIHLPCHLLSVAPALGLALTHKNLLVFGGSLPPGLRPSCPEPVVFGRPLVVVLRL